MRPSGLTCPPPSREPLDPPSSYERHVPRIAWNTRRNTGLPRGIQPRNFPSGLIDAPVSSQDTRSRVRFGESAVVASAAGRWSMRFWSRFRGEGRQGGEGRELIILARRGGGLTMIASVRAKICEDEEINIWKWNLMLWVGCSMQFPFHFRLIASSDINYFEVRRCFGSIVGRGIKVKFVTKASRVKNHD